MTPEELRPLIITILARSGRPLTMRHVEAHVVLQGGDDVPTFDVQRAVRGLLEDGAIIEDDDFRYSVGRQPLTETFRQLAEAAGADSSAVIAERNEDRRQRLPAPGTLSTAQFRTLRRLPDGSLYTPVDEGRSAVEDVDALLAEVERLAALAADVREEDARTAERWGHPSIAHILRHTPPPEPSSPKAHP